MCDNKLVRAQFIYSESEKAYDCYDKLHDSMITKISFITNFSVVAIGALLGFGHDFKGEIIIIFGLSISLIPLLIALFNRKYEIKGNHFENLFNVEYSKFESHQLILQQACTMSQNAKSINSSTVKLGFYYRLSLIILIITIIAFILFYIS